MKTIALMVLLSSCAVASAGELADIHHAAAPGKPNLKKSRTTGQINSTNHGITEIGIERSACFGTCPVYTFVVKSDGTFRYKGVNFVERKGEVTGTISIGQFHQIARLIRDSDYMRLENSYAGSDTDQPTVFTMVVMNGKRKVISNHADAGPTKLWAIEQLIDELLPKGQRTEPAAVESEKVGK